MIEAIVGAVAALTIAFLAGQVLQLRQQKAALRIQFDLCMAELKTRRDFHEQIKNTRWLIQMDDDNANRIAAQLTMAIQAMNPKAIN